MQRGEKTPEFPRREAGQIGGAGEHGEHVYIAQIRCAGVRRPGREVVGERSEVRRVRRRDLGRSRCR